MKWVQMMIPWIIMVVFLFLPQVSGILREIGNYGGILLGVGILVFGFNSLERPAKTSPSPLIVSIQKGFILTAVALWLIMNFPVGDTMCRIGLLPHSSGQADAIIVLASGFHSESMPTFAGLQRVLHGCSLLKDGRAPRILFSTSEFVKKGWKQAYWVASLTSLLGLASGSYEIVEKGVDTRTEASEFAKILFPQNIRKILLVTNGPHILRSVRVFEKQGFEVLPAPVQTASTIDSACDERVSLFDYAVHEWAGLFLYWIRGDIDFPFK